MLENFVPFFLEVHAIVSCGLALVRYDRWTLQVSTNFVDFRLFLLPILLDFFTFSF